MSHRATKIRNAKTIKALRGDILTIDLGKTYDGTITAWLKKTRDSATYREFDIVDNRYLVLSRLKTRDFYDGDTLTESVTGKWLFDAEFLKTGGAVEDTETIFSGTVLFVDDITGSHATEAIYLDENGFNDKVMMKVLYDPDLIEADVFDIDNMKESATKKVMTSDERDKLAAILDSKYRGLFSSELNLPIAGIAGDYADVDLGVGSDVVRYIWDLDDNSWILQQGISSALTDGQIKTQYENNLNTNSYTDLEKSKLANLQIPTNTINTGTDVDLSNPATTFKTDVANNATAYAVAGAVVTGGNEIRLINAATEPTVTGATKIAGSDFVANTNMYKITWNNGTISEYHFQEI